MRSEALAKHIAGLSTKERQVLEQRCHLRRLSRVKLRCAARNVISRCGDSYRALRDGCIAEVEPSGFYDANAKPSDWDWEQNLAIVLWEFPVGTELTEMLELFRLACYDILLYRDPGELPYIPSNKRFSREYGRYYYFFDGDGRVHKEWSLVDRSKDEVLSNPILCEAITHLDNGDTREKLEKEYSNTRHWLKNSLRWQEFDIGDNQYFPGMRDIVASIKQPRIIKAEGVSRPDVIEQVEVCVTLVKSVYGKDVIKHLRPKLRLLNALVVEKVAATPTFDRLSPLLNFFEISNISVTPDWTLRYTFTLKTEKEGLKDGQSEE